MEGNKKTTKLDSFIKKYNPEYIKEGDNINFPTKGSNVTVHYTGTFQDGSVFDSSRKKDKFFQFQLGVGQVIKCWDNVVASMSKGERIKVTCPSGEAYGKSGIKGVIPPNSDLNFDIELFKWDNK